MRKQIGCGLFATLPPHDNISIFIAISTADILGLFFIKSIILSELFDVFSELTFFLSELLVLVSEPNTFVSEPNTLVSEPNTLVSTQSRHSS